MTSHELARKLLAMPDLPVTAYERGGCSECDPEGYNSCIYHEIDHIETTMWTFRNKKPERVVVL